MKTKKYFLILFIIGFITLTAQAQHFASLQNGLHGGGTYVRSMFTDTIANLLYVSGRFFRAGGINAHNIASWNGANWDSLGSGLSPTNNWMAYATGMCRYDNELYVGGGFIGAGTTNANCLAHWDGSNWYALPASPNGEVECIMVFNNELYIGGTFDSVGSLPVNGLAKWDGINWSNAHAFPDYQSGTGVNPVACMAEYQGHLYVGGNFGSFTQHAKIVYWDGTQWLGMPNGGIVGGADWVEDMKVYQNELYVAGYFDTAQGNIGNNIQKWNGTTWSDVGGGTGGINGQIHKLVVFNNKLYALGVLQTAGGIPADRIASWDGTNWCGLGSIFDNVILTGAVYKDSLYIGGGFWTIDGDSMNYVSKWIGGNYTAVCTTTGINEIENEEEISIYPNPASATITIETKEIKKRKLTIINVLGEKMYTTTILNLKTEIDISTYPSGLYVVEVVTDEGIQRKKFVKE